MATPQSQTIPAHKIYGKRAELKENFAELGFTRFTILDLCDRAERESKGGKAKTPAIRVQTRTYEKLKAILGLPDLPPPQPKRPRGRPRKNKEEAQAVVHPEAVIIRHEEEVFVPEAEAEMEE